MRTLPDHLRKGMKLVIVGCNPSESSVRVGHYYAGRANQFWPMLYEGGVVPEPFDYHDDKRVIEFGDERGRGAQARRLRRGPHRTVAEARGIRPARRGLSRKTPLRAILPAQM
jgi:G:T/U-mismatch repair DNA glycosylase